MLLYYLDNSISSKAAVKSLDFLRSFNILNTTPISVELCTHSITHHLMAPQNKQLFKGIEQAVAIYSALSLRLYNYQKSYEQLLFNRNQPLCVGQGTFSNLIRSTCDGIWMTLTHLFKKSSIYYIKYLEMNGILLIVLER